MHAFWNLEKLVFSLWFVLCFFFFLLDKFFFSNQRFMCIEDKLLLLSMRDDRRVSIYSIIYTTNPSFCKQIHTNTKTNTNTNRNEYRLFFLCSFTSKSTDSSIESLEIRAPFLCSLDICRRLIVGIREHGNDRDYN